MRALRLTRLWQPRHKLSTSLTYVVSQMNKHGCPLALTEQKENAENLTYDHDFRNAR